MAKDNELTKVIRNLPGTNGDDCEIRSAVQDRPGCSTHRGASSWNDVPAGAAFPQKTGIQPCKLPRSTLSLNRTQSVHRSTALREKSRNSHRPQ